MYVHIKSLDRIFPEEKCISTLKNTFSKLLTLIFSEIPAYVLHKVQYYTLRTIKFFLLVCF